VDATGSDHAEEGGEHAIEAVACFSVVATNVANVFGTLYVDNNSRLMVGVSNSLQIVVGRRKSNVVIILVLIIAGEDDGGVSGSNLHLGGAGGGVGTTCIIFLFF
jgi:hypothetical protein